VNDDKTEQSTVCDKGSSYRAFDENKDLSQSSSSDWNYRTFGDAKASMIKTYLTPHYGISLDEMNEKIFSLSVKKMVNLICLLL
jgi:hypothetical protein